MEDNLFVNLRKYWFRDKLDLLENFLIEVFVYLLKNSSEVMVVFLEEINLKLVFLKVFNVSSYEVLM